MTRKKSLFHEAATLILVARRIPANPQPDLQHTSMRPELKVLMIQRSSSSSFMPKAGAFPGGMTDKADFSPEWKEIYAQNSDWQLILNSLPKSANLYPPIYTRSRNEFLPAKIGFRICAIRETFEESGLLLLKKNGDPIKNSVGLYGSNVTLTLSELQEWRKIVHKDASQFLTLCRELKAVPDIWSLYDWSNWFTPAGYIKRFDTAFYMCCLDYIKDTVEDLNSEVKKLFWATPLEMLLGHRNGKLLLYPPQIYELSRLLNFKSVQELLIFSGYRARSYVTLQYLTVPIRCKNGTITVLNGDSLYPLGQLPIRENIKVSEDEIWYGELINKEEDTIEDLNASSKHLHRFVFPNFRESFSKLNENSARSTPYSNVWMKDGHKPMDLSWLL